MLVREKLKKLRKERGYTQESFSDEIGISSRTYANIEQGISFPSKKIREIIMKKLNIETLAIFDITESGKRHGKGSEEICENMTKLSVNKKEYSIEDIRKIRKIIQVELKDRKLKQLNIKAKTSEGINCINKRCSQIASADLSINITEEDINLYRRCTNLVCRKNLIKSNLVIEKVFKIKKTNE